MLARLAAALCLLLPVPALAAVGEQHRVAVQPSAMLRDAQHRSDLRITVWYPAAAGAPTRSIDIPPEAPEFKVGSVAADAPFADTSRHPIILLSHGFGGSARIMGWFGLALAEHGYVVVAVDHPGNNGIEPLTKEGAVLWWDRADDLKTALATVLADPKLKDHLDAARVGVAGFSIGGLTALVAGGAKTDPNRMIQFCHEHPADGTCKPQREFALSPDDAVATLASPALATERKRARDDHSVPEVKAIFAMAPVVQPLTPASLRVIREPVVILAGADDVTVPPATHALIAKRLIPGAKVTILPDVTHYSFLATCSGSAAKEVPVCRDATNQETAHRLAIRAAIALFERALR